MLYSHLSCVQVKTKFKPVFKKQLDELDEIKNELKKVTSNYVCI